ncbi:uncharacterized protein LOC113502522 [Trichoplusia ni]|uniref:Uncharacterized protein LOC113502522 n=1 Tax=Trichoplusia ni TaxID=7111 RepID=A0A7E5WHU7_TRINI|nr:uncharacterized protein LOC113502522 [Trichoplusia ni]
MKINIFCIIIAYSQLTLAIYKSFNAPLHFPYNYNDTINIKLILQNAPLKYSYNITYQRDYNITNLPPLEANGIINAEIQPLKIINQLSKGRVRIQVVIYNKNNEIFSQKLIYESTMDHTDQMHACLDIEPCIVYVDFKNKSSEISSESKKDVYDDNLKIHCNIVGLEYSCDSKDIGLLTNSEQHWYQYNSRGKFILFVCSSNI